MAVASTGMCIIYTRSIVQGDPFWVVATHSRRENIYISFEWDKSTCVREREKEENVRAAAHVLCSTPALFLCVGGSCTKSGAPQRCGVGFFIFVRIRWIESVFVSGQLKIPAAQTRNMLFWCSLLRLKAVSFNNNSHYTHNSTVASFSLRTFFIVLTFSLTGVK
jgi:hypothetical protein